MHVQLVALSSAFDGDGLQSLLQTPGVKLPRRGESQISLIKSAHDLTSWQEEAAVAPCALGRYRPGAACWTPAGAARHLLLGANRVNSEAETNLIHRIAHLAQQSY